MKDRQRLGLALKLGIQLRYASRVMRLIFDENGEHFKSESLFPT